MHSGGVCNIDLRDEAHVPVHRAQVELAQIDVAKGDLAGARVVEAQE